MSHTIEIEKTFLAKSIPIDLATTKSKKIMDVYIPGSFEKPTIRLRQNGDTFEITKKVQTNPADASVHQEFTIPVTKEEFNVLGIGGKSVSKIRYYFKINNYSCELDVFLDGLSGFVLVDFEFNSQEEYDSFVPPDFCGADATQENFVAGKNLAGKTYLDISNHLDRLQYKKIML